MPLSLPLFPFFDKYVIHDGVSGIVNANKRSSSLGAPTTNRAGRRDFHDLLPCSGAKDVHLDFRQLLCRACSSLKYL